MHLVRRTLNVTTSTNRQPHVTGDGKWADSKRLPKQRPSPSKYASFCKTHPNCGRPFSRLACFARRVDNPGSETRALGTARHAGTGPRRHELALSRQDHTGTTMLHEIRGEETAPNSRVHGFGLVGQAGFEPATS